MSLSPHDNTDDGISFKLTHFDDEDALHKGSITIANVDILLVKTKNKIGNIRAFIVHRPSITEGEFYEAFKKSSCSNLDRIGHAIMENRFGRTKLQSLVDDRDDHEVDFMYIEKFHIDKEYKQHNGSCSSDVGATALRLFLHSPFIRGEGNYSRHWQTSSVAYVLDPDEAEPPEQQPSKFRQTSKGSSKKRSFTIPAETEEERMEHVQRNKQERLARIDAIQFLRNGFYQDPALARDGGFNARILVASCKRMSQPMKSQEDVLSVKFAPLPRPVRGHDAKILAAVEKACAYDEHDDNQFHEMIREVNAYIALGGTILRSNALHAAVARNNHKVVTWLLFREPIVINTLNAFKSTPLMIAADTAVERSTVNERVPDSRVMDKLLACGASTSMQDGWGMTAYGRFKYAAQKMGGRSDAGPLDSLKSAAAAAAAATNGGSHDVGDTSLSYWVVEQKLYPPKGPSSSDISGGIGGQTGLVDYAKKDRGEQEQEQEQSQEMSGSFVDELEEEEDGDDDFFQNLSWNWH